MIHTRLEHLTKTYSNGFKAIQGDGISLTVEDGEFIVLLGPSGCGKSTILRMIAGLESITSGNLYIQNKKANDIEPGDRNIAMVFQNYALYPHMNVYKNMSYGLKNHGYPKNEIQQRVHETAKTLGISHLLHNKPAQLSGGEKQRVAMGRAIARHPVLFLFDEPLSNLDAKLRTHMRNEIKHLHQRLKTTSLYVTHDQVEAMTMASRIVVLNKGSIEQIGTPEEVYKKPRTLFVANFIGSPAINCFEARYENETILCHEQRIPLPHKKLMENNADIIIAIRPEDILLSSKKPQEPHIRFKTRIVEKEHLGSQYLLHLKIETSNEQKTQTEREKSNLRVLVYNTSMLIDTHKYIDAHIALKNILIYDKATGHAL